MYLPNAHNLNAYHSPSIPIAWSLSNLEVNIFHNLGRLLKLWETKRPTGWVVNDMCNMIFPKEGLDWDASHPQLSYQGVTVTLWLINDQSIFITTQETDNLKSYAFRLWALGIIRGLKLLLLNKSVITFVTLNITMIMFCKKWKSKTKSGSFMQLMNELEFNSLW